MKGKEFKSMDDLPQEMKDMIDNGQAVAIPVARPRFGSMVFVSAAAVIVSMVIAPFIFGASTVFSTVLGVLALVAVYSMYRSLNLLSKYVTAFNAERAYNDLISRQISAALERAGTLSEQTGLTKGDEESPPKVH